MSKPRRLVDYLTTEEVAEHYRTTASTVRYWRMIGYGPTGVKVGRRVLVPLGEIEKFDALLTEQAIHDGDAA